MTKNVRLYATTMPTGRQVCEENENAFIEEIPLDTETSSAQAAGLVRLTKN